MLIFMINDAMNIKLFFPTNHFRVMVWVENDPLNITPYWKNQLWRWVENDPLDINGLKARSSRKHLRELTYLKLSSGYYSFSLANHFCSTLHCDITHVKGHEREFRSRYSYSIWRIPVWRSHKITIEKFVWTCKKCSSFTPWRLQ